MEKKNVEKDYEEDNAYISSNSSNISSSSSSISCRRGSSGSGCSCS